MPLGSPVTVGLRLYGIDFRPVFLFIHLAICPVEHLIQCVAIAPFRNTDAYAHPEVGAP
jgi:hypothetical protein